MPGCGPTPGAFLAPSSATWQLSCAAHPWDLVGTKPIDWFVLVHNNPDDIAFALFLFLFVIALLGSFLYRTIWLLTEVLRFKVSAANDCTPQRPLAYVWLCQLNGAATTASP